MHPNIQAALDDVVAVIASQPTWTHWTTPGTAADRRTRNPLPEQYNHGAGQPFVTRPVMETPAARWGFGRSRRAGTTSNVVFGSPSVRKQLIARYPSLFVMPSEEQYQDLLQTLPDIIKHDRQALREGGGARAEQTFVMKLATAAAGDPGLLKQLLPDYKQVASQDPESLPEVQVPTEDQLRAGHKNTSAYLQGLLRLAISPRPEDRDEAAQRLLDLHSQVTTAVSSPAAAAPVDTVRRRQQVERLQEIADPRSSAPRGASAPSAASTGERSPYQR